MQLLPCLCCNAPVWCLAIISCKGEIVWSTDEELYGNSEYVWLYLFLCTILNSDDPKLVHVTCVSSGASSKNEAWPSIGFCVWRWGQARARNLSGCSLKSWVPLLPLDYYYYFGKDSKLCHIYNNLHWGNSSCLVDMSCFQGLFFCPEAVSLLLHNFCVYHITPQGHEVSYDVSFFSLHWFIQATNHLPFFSC